MSTTSLSMPAQPVESLRTLRIFLTEVRYEFVRALRTKAYSMSVIGFPLVFYVFFGLLMNRGETIGGVSLAKYMLGSYAVFGALGAALFGIGVGLSGDLSAGWLELKRASPMPPLAYLMAKCCTAIAFGIIIVSALSVLGVTAGHVHLTLVEFARLIGLTVAGAIPFASLGLLLALVAPFNAAPGFANMIYLPMSFLGGLWIPIRLLPHFLQTIAPVFPTYHLAQLTVGALGYPSTGSVLTHTLALATFTAIMLGCAGYFFRKREENS
jgi:ABC-2 type transport system permease protein